METNVLLHHFHRRFSLLLTKVSMPTPNICVSSVVCFGRSGLREAAPQTGVVVSAAHAWEAGPGTGFTDRNRSFASTHMTVQPTLVLCQSLTSYAASPTLLPRTPKALMTIGADRGKANDGLSSALLVVFLDSARNLPVSDEAPTSANSSLKFSIMFFSSRSLGNCWRQCYR